MAIRKEPTELLLLKEIEVAMDIVIITALTLIVVILSFLAQITDWFKTQVPIRFGFLYNNQIVDRIPISSGHNQKPIFLRFENLKKVTLTGIIIEMRFLNPLALSGSDRALGVFPGKTIHYRVPDRSYYLIRHTDLSFLAREKNDLRIELNTVDISPGTCEVEVNIHSNAGEFKSKQANLLLDFT